MSTPQLPPGGDASSGALGSSVGVKELIGRLERLLEKPRPAEGYPAECFVEAWYLGDIAALAMLSLRSN
jgi:hypothetical protein